MLPGPVAECLSTGESPGFSLAGTGAAGVAYELDAATNLSSPINWVFVTNAVAGQDGLFQFIDTQAAAYPKRFYRIKSSY